MGIHEQHFTYSLTRTIEIEVEGTYNTNSEEVEIDKAIDCETGEEVTLDQCEIDEVLTQGLSDHLQGIKDAADEHRFELERERRWEREREGGE